MNCILLALRQHDAKTAQNIMKQWRQRACEATDFIFEEDVFKLKEQDKCAFILLVAEVYKATALFPDSELKALFAALGIDGRFLRWFISLDDITAALTEIERDGQVQLLWGPMLYCMKAHLEIKINTEMIKWAGFTATLNKKKDVPKVKTDVYNVYRMRDKQTGLLKRPSVYAGEINDLILELEGLIPDKSTVKENLLDLGEGNTKKTFLKIITKVCAIYTGGNDLVHRFYPLLQLLSPEGDLYLPEEQKYTWSAKRNEEDQYFNRTFRSFQTKRIKDITR